MPRKILTPQQRDAKRAEQNLKFGMYVVRTRPEESRRIAAAYNWASDNVEVGADIGLAFDRAMKRQNLFGYSIGGRTLTYKQAGAVYRALNSDAVEVPSLASIRAQEGGELSEDQAKTFQLMDVAYQMARKRGIQPEAMSYWEDRAKEFIRLNSQKNLTARVA